MIGGCALPKTGSARHAGLSVRRFDDWALVAGTAGRPMRMVDALKNGVVPAAGADTTIGYGAGEGC